MRSTTSSFKDWKILSAKGNADTYLEKIFSLISNHYSSDVVAIGVFGSVAKGTSDEFSDVDILVILSGTIKDRNRKNLTKQLYLLENEFNKKTGKDSFNNRFFRSILHITGMFRSVFITDEQSWIEMNFNKIFNLGKIIHNIAPNHLVLLSMFQDLRFFFGSNIASANKEHYNPKKHTQKLIKNLSFWKEWIKAYMTAQLLSIGALIISPFAKNSTKFSIESIKWSFLSMDQLKILKKQSGLFNIQNNRKIDSSFNHRKINSSINNFRRKYERNIIFNFLSPYLVWQIFKSIRNS